MQTEQIATETACPHCNRPYRKAKPAKLADVVDVASLTNAEMFAHYKRTSPIEDVRFFVQMQTLPADVRADAEQLLAESLTCARGQVFRRLTALQDRWRCDSNDRERAEHVANGETLRAGMWLTPEQAQYFDESTATAATETAATEPATETEAA